jgi:hypothetical protein
MAGDADSTWVVTRQYYMDGSLKLRADAPAFDWAGVYNVKTTDENGLYIADDAGFDWPTEFQIEVEYNEGWDMYLVTKVFGLDVVALNNGGLEFTPSEDGKKVEISIGYLYSVKQGEVYLALRDMNMSTDAIDMVVNEDGTMSVAGLSVVTTVAGVATPTLNAFYSNLLVTKEAAEPEAPAFELAGDYKLKATVNKYYQGDVEFPAEFDVKIEYFDGSAYGMDSYYYIASFMGKNIAAANQSIDINVVKEGEEYELVAGGLCGSIVPGELYYMFYDMNASKAPVSMTVNEDGTISIANFFIKVKNYNDGSETAGAYYQNVVLTKKGETSIENVTVENTAVKGIFDMQGRKIENITAPGLYIIDGVKVLVK